VGQVVNLRPIGKRPPGKLSTVPGGAVWWTAFTLAAFLFADAAIFRSGWYDRYLEPDSSAGTPALRLFWLAHMPPLKVPDVMVVGDSRIAEGFSVRTASAAIGGKFHFENFGMGGSNPRIWYYVLRDADPQRNRFAAIAIMVTPYSDEDGTFDDQNTIGDLNYSIAELRAGDCLDFARSFDVPDLQRRAFIGCLFKGATLRRDVQAFLANVRARLRKSRDWRDHGLGYEENYGGKAEDLSGLSADWTQRTIHYPPGVDANQISTVRDFVMPEHQPQTGALTRYRKLWLGRILDLYKNSGTRIIFFELPRAPLPIPQAAIPPRFIDSVRGVRNVTVLPPATFRDLERPDIFADGLHLNHLGRPIFSTHLAEQIDAVLGGR
jgi:hypothetical protein